MKRISGFIAGAVLAMATNASAVTIGPNGDYLDLGSSSFQDTKTETLTMADFGNAATMSLLLEMAAFADQNSFGIYGFTNSESSLAIGDKLEIFRGSDSAVISTTLAFDSSTGTVTNSSTGQTASIGTAFGFYITTPENFTYYTQHQLNQDGKDHFKIFDTRGDNTGALLGSNLVFAIEDLYELGDADFNDLVVGMQAAPVPEPSTMVLLGTALLGLAFYGKKRIKTKS